MRPFSLVLIVSNFMVFIAACVWPAGASFEVCRICMGLCDYPLALFMMLLVSTGLFLFSGDEA